MKTKTGKGVGILIRSILRRDRIRLLLWPILFAIVTAYSALSMADMLPDQAAMEAQAEVFKNPFTLAMSGPGYGLDNPTIGVLFAHKSFVVFAIAAAIMSILLFVRYTRAEEAAGRSEMLRSTKINRHANNLAALIIVTGFNLVIGLLGAIGLGLLGIDSVTWPGAILYGASLTAVGLVFMGAAALMSQFMASSRTATSLTIVVLAISFIFRAIGDLGIGRLTWLSPLGWAQATRPFVDERWWPLLFCLLLTVLLLYGAFKLSDMRDLGAGFVQPRTGRAVASNNLLSPLGVAFRLQRGSLIGWLLGIFLFALGFGTLTGSVITFVNDPQAPKLLNIMFIDEFYGRVIQFFAILAALFAIISTTWLNREERAWHAEVLLGTKVTRSKWFFSHTMIALVGSTLMLLLAGLGFGLSAMDATNDASTMTTLLSSSLAYLPAVWTMAGISTVVFGILPRARILPYALLLYSLVLSMFVGVSDIPQWMIRISPLGYVPLVPYTDVSFPLMILLAIAGIAFITAGLTGFRRRDLRM